MKQKPEQRALEKAIESINVSLFHPLSAAQVGQRRLGYMKAWIEEVEPKEAEIERLRHKAEVFDQLDAYGCSSAKIWLDKCEEIERLRGLVQRFVDHNTKWLGKGCLEADIQWDAIVRTAKSRASCPPIPPKDEKASEEESTEGDKDRDTSGST